MNKKLILAAALGATLTAGTALAQDTPPPARSGGHGGGMGMMMRADANSDGIVTRAEVLAQVDQRFARMDKNGDGQISADERARPDRGVRGRLARGAAERRGVDIEQVKAMRDRMRARLDTDGNGAISLAEQRDQATRMFDRIDANHDGSIDQAERDAAREMMANMRARHGGQNGTPPAGNPAVPQDD